MSAARAMMGPIDAKGAGHPRKEPASAPDTGDSAMPAPPRDNIRPVHARTCAARTGAPCDCTPTYQARATVNGKRRSRNAETYAAARAWLTDVERGAVDAAANARGGATVRAAGDAYLAGMRDGTIGRRGRRGTGPYSPGTADAYASSLARHAYPRIGARRLAAITAVDAQAFVDALNATGAAASTVRNAVIPLAAVWRHARARGRVATNPWEGLELPEVAKGGRRAPAPQQGAAMLAEISDPAIRALWATALYAGLRLGELRELRWSDVNLPAMRISVSRSVDLKGRVKGTKSHAGTRDVAIMLPLVDHLAALRAERGADLEPGALVFAGRARMRLSASRIRSVGAAAWASLEPQDAPLYGLHECRHAAITAWIHAGLNIKVVSRMAGHASVAITLDRYGHLFPDSLDAARVLANAYYGAATNPTVNPNQGETGAPRGTPGHRNHVCHNGPNPASGHGFRVATRRRPASPKAA